ncbi:MAG: nucleotidyltransferase family protein [Planctomycetes bacterium]|nr:nucleotidyltransferase family protein [Planctomycetota bacterium]
MDRQTVLMRLKENLEQIRLRFSVERLSVFGSVIRDKASEDSDVDVLVAFEKKANLDVFMDLKFYLEELLGMGVDLVTDKALRPQVRRAIEQEMVDVA